MAKEMCVIAKCIIPMIHMWPDAPDQVKFLRNDHRHQFHITAWKKVGHDDRQVEVIMLRADIVGEIAMQFPYDGVSDCNYAGDKSCEQIARTLVHNLELVGCEVLEDGENGAVFWDWGNE